MYSWDDANNASHFRRKEELCKKYLKPCGRSLPYWQASPSEIDFSDMPATSESDWANAKRGQFYRPIKKQITVRIDADVVEWLKFGSVSGYQKRLNGILRDAMLATKQSQNR